MVAAVLFGSALLQSQHFHSFDCHMARRPESELDKFKWWANLNTLAREAVIALDDLDDVLEENPGAAADLGNLKRDLEKAHNKLRAV